MRTKQGDRTWSVQLNNAMYFLWKGSSVSVYDNTLTELATGFRTLRAAEQWLAATV